MAGRLFLTDITNLSGADRSRGRPTMTPARRGISLYTARSECLTD